jgi:hypothetical protein
LKRTNVNFLVDTLALVALVFLTATGGIIRYVLPAGSGHTRVLWGLDRHAWGHVHFWIAIAFFVVMVVHVALHWGWITCVVRWDTRGRSKGRAVLALIAVIALVALAAAPFFGTVEEIEEGRQGGRGGAREGRAREYEGGAVEFEGVPVDYEGADAEHRGEGHTIHGSMTLRDVQELTGVPVDHIITALRLPADAPRDERLGRLRRSYGFEIDDVRRVVGGYGTEGQGDTGGGP